MSRMKCTELLKNGYRSLVEVKDLDIDKVISYVVCSEFDNSKAYGSKWTDGSYYNVEETIGLYKESQLKAAVQRLYGISEPKVSYDRVLEFAKDYFRNMDIDDEMRDSLLNDYNITEDEAELFGIKEKLFQKEYQIVEVTFKREQTVTVKVVMPSDASYEDAENYVENQCYLEDSGDIENDDWYCEDYELIENDLTEEEVRCNYDVDEFWNGCDFPEDIY